MKPEIGHDRALKELRLLQACLLVTIPLYVYAGEVLGSAKPKDIRRLGLFLVLLAALNIWYVLSDGRRAVAKASDILRSRGEDALAIRRWYGANVVSLASSEPLALYGLILRIFGGALLQAVPFYACALLLLLVSTPRRVRVSASPSPDR
jgi:hypothetical protein